MKSKKDNLECSHILQFALCGDFISQVPCDVLVSGASCPSDATLGELQNEFFPVPTRKPKSLVELLTLTLLDAYIMLIGHDFSVLLSETPRVIDVGVRFG